MKLGIRILLYPFSLLFGIVVWIRNKLFDYQVIKSTRFNLPIISVGNLAVGGTGKTPQVEYLLQLFNQHKIKVAVLSRGYKRKTKGFLWVEQYSNTHTVGDEALQVKAKFSEAIVAVDEDRVHGVKEILKSKAGANIQVLLLDDAYQHRWISPKLSILLLEYKQLLCGDYLLPAGRLREPFYQKKRADIIIVTKCDANLPTKEQRSLTKKIGKPQEIFFTTIAYENIVPLSAHKKTIPTPDAVLLVTGIANPSLLVCHLKKKYSPLKLLSFPDHHTFKPSDIKRIRREYEQLPQKNKLILTTEKDSYRLKHKTLKNALKPIWNDIYYIPIGINFLNNESSIFDKKIIKFIKNQV